MIVKLLNYNRVVSEFTTQKSRTLLVHKYGAYGSTYDQDADTLYLHLTRERIAPAVIPTFNVGITDRIGPP